MAAAALLVVAVLGVYAPLRDAGFVRIDDPHYVSDNAIVARGLTFEGLGWAWTTFHASNWHPLTWWSHMLDAQLFGLRPFGHHVTNVLLHAANALLLWYAFTRLTGAVWRSWIVAWLFALHPSHVESVAWVSERKDVLSTLFLALTLIAYERHARSPSARRMVLVALCLGFGLACKPMLVTVPCLLLLLDVWPLCRERAWPLVLEKWPLAVLSAASCVVTIMAQSQWGSVASVESSPMTRRVIDAVIAYAAYLRLAVWPANSSVHVPHAAQVPWGEFAIAILVFVGISFVAWRQRERRPYVLVGWSWYVVALVPVIGLVQVGTQSMADRYTYWTLLGPFVAITWYGAEAIENWFARRSSPIVASRRVPTIVIVVIAVTAPLGWFAHRRVGDWHDSLTLFESAVAAHPDSEVALQSLGDELVERGRVDEGIARLRQAVALAPEYGVAHNGLGVALRARGDDVGGLAELQRATESSPTLFEPWFNLGVARYEAQDVAGAAQAFDRAVALRAWHYEARANLATALVGLGRLDEARAHCRAAASFVNDVADDHRRLAAIADAADDVALARAELDHVLRLDPTDEAARARALELARQAGDSARAAELERMRASPPLTRPR